MGVCGCMGVCVCQCVGYVGGCMGVWVGVGYVNGQLE